MADSKITDLSLTTTIASTDVFVMVDGDDTTMAVSGTDKKVQVGQIAVALGPFGLYLRSNTTANLTAGFNATDYAAGTKSSGTFTPDPASGNFQTVTNGGAHTLAVPGTSCTMILLYTNNGSAGTITTSGYTEVTGDSLTTTDTHKFIFYITKIGSSSHLVVKALQ